MADMFTVHQIKEAIANAEFAVSRAGGVFNEDLAVLDGVDPQAEDMLRMSIKILVPVARAYLAQEQEQAECDDFLTAFAEA